MNLVPPFVNGSKKVNVIGVPLESIRCARWRDLDDAGEPLLSELESFFESYVKREGRKFQLLGRVGRKRALELLQHAVV